MIELLIYRSRELNLTHLSSSFAALKIAMWQTKSTLSAVSRFASLSHITILHTTFICAIVARNASPAHITNSHTTSDAVALNNLVNLSLLSQALKDADGSTVK